MSGIKREWVALFLLWEGHALTEAITLELPTGDKLELPKGLKIAKQVKESLLVVDASKPYPVIHSGLNTPLGRMPVSVPLMGLTISLKEVVARLRMAPDRRFAVTD